MLTVEYSEVEGIGIEALLEVVLVEMARRVDVSAGMERQLELGEIEVGAVLHAPEQREELAESVGVDSDGRVGSEAVSDVVDHSAFVVIPPYRNVVV